MLICIKGQWYRIDGIDGTVVHIEPVELIFEPRENYQKITGTELRGHINAHLKEMRSQERDFQNKY